MRGSVQKTTGARGVSWCYVIDLGRTADGKRDQKRKRGFPTRKAAQEAMGKELHERRAGTYVEPSTETVAAYLERWLAEAAAGWRESSAYTYTGIVRTRIVPHLGTIPLGKLTELDVQGCYRRLGETGLAPRTVRQTHTVLRGALAQAVAWRLLSRNPADDAKAPVPARGTPKVWTPEEARAFLAATAADELAPVYRLALDSGMRAGELFAPAWSDVNLARGTVTVRRTLTRNRGGGWVIGEQPKTKGSRRTIPLAPSTVAAIRAYRARQAERRLLLGPDWDDGGLVFDRGNGREASPTTVQEALSCAIERAGVPTLTLHGLRHTCATLLLAAGVHPKIVQERLGHGSIAMTLDLYSHVSMTMQQGATDRLEALLGEAS